MATRTPRARSKPLAKTSKKPAKKPAKPAAARRAKPTAPATRTSALHAQAHARLVEQGRAALALIRERRADIAESYFDVGHALATLKSEAIALALGYADVTMMLRTELNLSVYTADKLIELATRVDRSLLRELHQERAAAILALVDATPEDDTIEQLLERAFPVPGGDALDLRTAPIAAIHAAAKAVRQHHAAETPTKSADGSTTTPEERAEFAALVAPVVRDRALSAETSFRLLASRGSHGPVVEARIPLARLRDVLARLTPR